MTVRRNSGADVGTRPRLNFIEGANISLSVADDVGDAEIDVTISASASASLPVDDTTSIVQDPVDPTRQMRIDVGGVATSTVRALTMPDQDVDLTPNTGTFPQATHASRHANGGTDELSVAGLSGELADAQPVAVEDDGVSVSTYSALNFTGAGVTVTDGGTKTNIAIPGGGGYSDLTNTHSPLALYHFNGDLTDSSGNGHTLTSSLSPLVFFQHGSGLSGVSIDNGSSSSVLATSASASFNLTGDLTIEVIVHQQVEQAVAALAQSICYLEGSGPSYYAACDYPGNNASSGGMGWFATGNGALSSSRMGPPLVRYTLVTGGPVMWSPSG